MWLPNVGNETISHFVSVFLVSLQLAQEHLLLVRNPKIENGQEERYEKQRPPRSEREWRTYYEKEGAEIHGVTNESVYAGRYNFLSFFDTDVRRCVCVHF